MKTPTLSEEKFLKGRGSQLNPFNPFLEKQLVFEHLEGIDEEIELNRQTQFFTEHPKKIVNKVDSPDLMMWSMNPYQGCEHGCVYCYARNVHNYWGFSAGVDFETKIIVKPTAPRLLEDFLMNPKWEATPLMLSGNTDCYQPIERKMKITREMLKVFVRFRHPVAIITKNQLICRDIDLLSDLASENLAHVFLSITGVDEQIRQKLEPRTASYKSRFKTLEKLSSAGIPVGVMIGPIIPGLTDDQIPAIMKEAVDHGASSVAYTMVRLNGAVGQIFTDWIWKAFPEKAQKVLHNIESVHQGKLNDSRWGTRLSGDGNLAEAIHQLFETMKNKYFAGKPKFEYNLNAFRRPGQLSLF